MPILGSSAIPRRSQGLAAEVTNRWLDATSQMPGNSTDCGLIDGAKFEFTGLLP
jgi:hypothetical protein